MSYIIFFVFCKLSHTEESALPTPSVKTKTLKEGSDSNILALAT